ncbi:MAG: DEAD/DEAH box helicase, partial [Opitutales bacterium]|nr:DEAD/DEAH box helicase [Opitutales bacterium]
EKFFPNFKCSVFDSNTDFAAQRGGIWLASYTQLRRNKHKLENAEFEIAVLDEAQYIKNPDSKISATCMSIKSKNRLALSGTPIENRLTDLWTIFRWLMPGLMGGRAQFERRLSEPDFSSTIKRQIAPFVLRRLKSEVARELPPKFVADLPCPMSDMQNAEYSRLMRIARETFKNSSGDSRARVSVLSLITRLRQAACDPALLPNLENCDFSNSGKISALCASLSSIISSGRKAVVFSQFVKFINRMREKVAADFPEADIFELTGDVRDRASPVESFQKTKKPAVIFVSLRAGGTGITLTGADYVFLADPWWNPAVEEQAIDRVHRIGKSSDVFVYRLVGVGTIEESVRKLQLKKKEMFDDIIGSLSSNPKSFDEAVAEILEVK